MKRPWLISFLLFFWLATGYGVIHTLGSIWLVSIAQLFWPDRQPYEQIHLTEDGEPIIQVGNDIFRKLDGTIVEKTLGMGQKFVRSGSWISHAEPGEASGWSHRILSYYDFQRPSGAWYLIAPPNYSRHAYFIGFDCRTRRPIGYIGLNGFSPTAPTIDQSFPITTSMYGALYYISSSALTPAGSGWAQEMDESVETNYVPLSNAEPDTVWLLSQGTIYEIRLGTRQVRPLIENRPEIRTLAGVRDQQDEKSRVQLLARTDTELLVIDPQSATVDPIRFGTNNEIADSHWLQYWKLKNGQRILQSSYTETKQDRRTTHNQLAWIGSNGNIERTADIDLHFGSGRVGPVAISLIAPFPLASIMTCLVAPTITPRAIRELNGFTGTTQDICLDYWFWLASSLLIGLLAGWSTWRREGDVFGKANFFWPVVVGAGGLFGWMGYICLRPLPAKQPNKQWMPARPEPAKPLGTEIFV